MRTGDGVGRIGRGTTGRAPADRARMRAGLRVLPAVLPVVVVLGVGIGAVLAQSLGLLPLVGAARLTAVAYTDPGTPLGRAAALSLGITAAATAIAAAVGAVAGLVMAAGSRVVGLAGALTVPVPHLIGATTMGLLLADAGVLPRWLQVTASWPELVSGPWWIAVVLEYAWKESAFIALLVAATAGDRLVPLTRTAATLGAGRRARLRYVVLPLIAPAVVAGAGITAVYTLGSYEVAAVLGRPAPEPLANAAVRLFGSIDLAARPQAAAVAVLTIAVCLAAAAVTVLALRRVQAWR